MRYFSHTEHKLTHKQQRSSTMEQPEPDDNPDNEYMAMDPDQWGDQDDTYENGDTLGFEIGRRVALPVPGGTPKSADGATLQTSQIQNSPQPPTPLPNRYKTLRRPLSNGNREPERKDQSGNARQF